MKNVKVIKFPNIKDSRGILAFGEIKKHIPFPIQRIFWIFNIPTKDTVRGEHAHNKGEQVHVCFGGKAVIKLDDGKKKETVILNTPTEGLLVGANIWHSFTLSKGATLFVMASRPYSEKDYVRNYADFKKITAQK